MNETIESLAQDVRQLRSLVATHLNNPYAHNVINPQALPTDGTIDSTGFVNRNDFLQALGSPLHKSDGTDIFSLPAGFYKCYKPSGLPDKITTTGSVWFISVKKSTESSDYGLITIRNEFNQSYTAYLHNSSWSWLQAAEKQSLGGDLANTNCWYTVWHVENKMVVHVHVDLVCNVDANSYKTFGTTFPSGLVLSDWKSGKSEDFLWKSGVANSNGFYEPISLAFGGGALYVVNTTAKTLTRAYGDFNYELEKH